MKPISSAAARVASCWSSPSSSGFRGQPAAGASWCKSVQCRSVRGSRVTRIHSVGAQICGRKCFLSHKMASREIRLVTSQRLKQGHAFRRVPRVFSVSLLLWTDEIVCSGLPAHGYGYDYGLSGLMPWTQIKWARRDETPQTQFAQTKETKKRKTTETQNG